MLTMVGRNAASKNGMDLTFLLFY